MISNTGADHSGSFSSFPATDVDMMIPLPLTPPTETEDESRKIILSEFFDVMASSPPPGTISFTNSSTSGADRNHGINLIDDYDYDDDDDDMSIGI